METRHVCDWPAPPYRRLLLLPRTGLGSFDINHHVVLHLSDGRLVSACHRRKAVATLASDADRHLVVCGWLRRPVLVAGQSGGFGDDARNTALTNIFSGRPARGIVNRLMKELGPLNPAALQFPLATAASAPLRVKAESMANGDFSPLWAGQNVTGCKEIPASVLTEELASEICKV